MIGFVSAAPHGQFRHGRRGRTRAGRASAATRTEPGQFPCSTALPSPRDGRQWTFPGTARSTTAPGRETTHPVPLGWPAPMATAGLRQGPREGNRIRLVSYTHLTL